MEITDAVVYSWANRAETTLGAHLDAGRDSAGPGAALSPGGVVSLFRPRRLLEPAKTLRGRSDRSFSLSERHRVLGTPLITDEVPPGLEVAVFGLGCFWGAEEIFWRTPGVWSTSVGYAGGTTPNPSYEEVCSGRTNHTEAVRIVFDPTAVSFGDLVKVFFEVHDPTQVFRQGNDVGTQYRSAIYPTSPAQDATARSLRDVYGAELARRRLGPIATEIVDADTYYYAEDHHQQYLAKHPHGYRCHANTGVSFPADA